MGRTMELLSTTEYAFPTRDRRVSLFFRPHSGPRSQHLGLISPNSRAARKLHFSRISKPSRPTFKATEPHATSRHRGYVTPRDQTRHAKNKPIARCAFCYALAQVHQSQIANCKSQIDNL